MNTLDDPARTAAHNLLTNCAGLKPGQSLLIVSEDASLGHYDPTLSKIVIAAAAAQGIATEEFTVPFTETVTDLAPALTAAMNHADCSLFFARLGDQIRFLDHARGKRAIVSYALDQEMFASSFAAAHHHAFTALKQALDRAFASATCIHVTCPLGTAFEGPGHASIAQPEADTAVKRFPLSVFAPIPAQGFEGRIAQRGFITGTCSRFYQPYGVALESTLFVDFHDTQITGFNGTLKDVQAARTHYEMVANRFGIDRDFVHSWHAGIHPGCAYTRPATDNYARWCSGAFGNPRLLHFHTCGAYAPGEISLNIVDPTITVDGINVWEKGRLHPERIPGGADILNTYPCAKHAFENAADAIGL